VVATGTRREACERVMHLDAYHTPLMLGKTFTHVVNLHVSVENERISPAYARDGTRSDSSFISSVKEAAPEGRGRFHSRKNGSFLFLIARSFR